MDGYGASGENSLQFLTSLSHGHFEFSHFILYMLCMLISLEAKYVQDERKNSGCFIKIAPATHPIAGTSLWSELFQFSILDFIIDLTLGFFSIRELEQILLFFS